MRLKFGNRRLIINLKRFFTSLTILTLIAVCVTLPVDKLIIHRHKPNIPEARASDSQTEKVQPDYSKDLQTQSSNEKPDNLKVFDSQAENIQSDSSKAVQSSDASDEAAATSDENNEAKPSVDNEPEASKDYKAIFKNDIFIGDSITESLSFYEFIDDEHTFAKLGLTLAKAENEVNKLAELKPQNIYIMFGANDIDGVLTDERFVNNYVFLISKIREKSPQSTIYLQSILPVSIETGQKKPHLNRAHIEKLNSELEDMAKKEGVTYLNVASLLENMGQDIYEPDGIHLKSNFYPLWLDYLTNV